MTEEIRKILEEIRKNETELIKILDYQTDKLDQYKNNWKELKKMFEADEHFEDGCYCSEILSKMKELEENK